MEIMEVQLSARLRVVFMIGGSGIRTEFRPFLPSRCTPAEVKAYKTTRIVALHRLAVLTGAASGPIPGRVIVA